MGEGENKTTFYVNNPLGGFEWPFKTNIDLT